MSDTEFQKLLNRATKAAKAHSEIMEECSNAFKERYGIHYSEVDADGIIESIDLSGGVLTVADCDKEMAQCGYPPLRKEPNND